MRPIRLMPLCLLILFLGTAAASLAQAQTLAFPEAEGYGRFTRGGRGGKVFEVTTLNDSGPGSLRAAIEAEGPRIVLFRVSGTVFLKKELNIRNPFITIAGQTAPGDGICLANYALDIKADEVIVRHLRCRPGDLMRKELDALGGRRRVNVILDHCSASWGNDEVLSLYNSKNVTIQWCIISESFWESVHKKGHHGYGGGWGANGASFHHNLLANHTSRNPRFSDEPQGTIDYRNNVVYNWGFNSTYGGEGSHVNMINNYYKPGPATKANVRGRLLQPSTEDKAKKTWSNKFYLSGNFMFDSAEVTADNWLGVHEAPLDQVRADKPFPFAPVQTQSAAEAFGLVLAGAGATLPQRDPLDARIIEEVHTGTAKYGENYEGGGKGIINSQTAVGGWPELKSAPAPADSDHDGLPDAWERTHGLNPDDPSDGAKDRDGDGITNVEDYMNGIR